MKKAIYILIAIVAFSIGVAVFYLRPIVPIDTPISLYELRKNPSRYESLKFIVKGNLEVTKENSTYFFGLQDYKNDCSGNLPCYRGLELSKESEQKNSLLVNELADRNQSLGKTDFRQGVYVAEVEVTGYLDERVSMGIPMQIIKVEAIKQISPIKFVTSEEMLGVK